MRNCENTKDKIVDHRCVIVGQVYQENKSGTNV